MKPKYTEETIKKLLQYIREGDSQKTACIKTGIAEQTLYKWLNAHVELGEQIKSAKEEFRETITGKLEASLWKRAMGYDVKESEIIYAYDKDGNKHEKRKTEKTKHILPDTGALIFALTNVAPDKWVNKQKVETQKVDESNTDVQYRFEDLPEDVMFEIADKLQAVEYEKEKERKSKV